MEGRQLRDRNGIALDLVGVAGLAAFAIGLTWLQGSRNLGFDFGAAVDGVLGQLDITAPAALLVLGVTVLELAAGLVLARAARHGPFESLAESAIAAMVAAVLKDTLLLGTLAAFGLFVAPILAGVDAVIVAAAILPPSRRHLRPIKTERPWRDHVSPSARHESALSLHTSDGRSIAPAARPPVDRIAGHGRPQLRTTPIEGALVRPMIKSATCRALTSRPGRQEVGRPHLDDPLVHAATNPSHSKSQVRAFEGSRPGFVHAENGRVGNAGDGLGSWPLGVLVAVVWAGPVILQLASPVVPFIDVLPNQVAPVEHLRTFGWFSPLIETQSPIYGPSRTELGYDGLLGAVATMTGLPGGLAIAGFILPQTVLVAAGVHRLASAIRNGDPPVGTWALLAFALSQSFARLADARGTVVVLPLVCLGLAVAAELIRDNPESDAWRIGRGPVIGLALGAATLVHPVIGFFAIVTIGVVGLARPRAAAPEVFVAGVTAALVALPQLATMLGLRLPTLALGLGLPTAIVLGIVAGRVVERGPSLREGIVRSAELGRGVLAIAAGVVLIGAFALAILNADRLPAAAGEALNLALESSGILLITLGIGAALGSRGARSPIVLVGLVVGVVAVAITQVLPADLGFLGDALRFEVPKTVYYWLSFVAAAGAAPALAYAWAGRSRPPIAWAGRVAMLAAFVAVAALPLRFGNSGDDSKCEVDCAPINAYHLGEHRWSESFAIDLHYAAIGFWQGFPDPRLVVDRPRQEILEAVRAEIDAGRVRHDTPVLHVASSFQQWVATPLGVFDGVDETFVSLDPEVGHQTVGGRLFGLDELPGFLSSGLFGYVVLEPRDLPDAVRQQIEAAGYESFFANEQGEVFGRP